MTSAVHRSLLTVAAQLSYLCAFTLFDNQEQGASQHYYLTGLRLATEADDRASMALILRGLSLQAHSRGHRRQAVDLAEAAVGQTASHLPRNYRAALLGQQAVAAAAAGDRHRALSHLNAAERHLDRDSNAATPIGAYNRASFAHQQAEVTAALGDLGGAIPALRIAVTQRPGDERRSRLIVRHRLAEMQLSLGQLEAACSTWQLFLDDYPYVRSRRADHALASLRAKIHPYRASRAANTLLHRAATLPDVDL
ncbi:tol-pal system YbgF family protein [Streptomyces sp. NPDC056254]|uniref:tetratricopeptide repeat protein n=1 Tax=Streptomyces sp. NPDC056254 TaxID=3345763 RepID=UPI0035D76DB9